MTIYTTTLTSGSLTLNQSDGVTQISVQADSTSGSFSILGTGTFQGNSSTSVVLSAGQGWEAIASSPQSPIQGITITWLSGSVKVNMACQ